MKNWETQSDLLFPILGPSGLAQQDRSAGVCVPKPPLVISDSDSEEEEGLVSRLMPPSRLQQPPSGTKGMYTNTEHSKHPNNILVRFTIASHFVSWIHTCHTYRTQNAEEQQQDIWACHPACLLSPPPMAETHYGCVYLQSHSFRHYLQLMTIGEGWNIAQTVNSELHFPTQPSLCHIVCITVDVALICLSTSYSIQPSFVNKKVLGYLN